MRLKRSAAAPEERALKRRASRLDVRGEAREGKQFGAERERHLVEAHVAPLARQVIDSVANLDRVAGGAGQRLVHVGDQATVGNPGHSPPRRRRRRVRAAFEGRHEGAGAGLHVHDQALQPGREFLRQDPGGDQRDRFDSRGHIPNGVEARSAGARSPVWPMMAAAGFLHHPHEQREVGLRDVAGMNRACRAPPVWPRPRPEIIGTYAPQAASIGASMGSRRCRRRRRSSACRGSARANWLAASRSSRRTWSSRGSARRSRRAPCRERAPPSRRRRLSLADRAACEPADELADLARVKRRPSRFRADDLLRQDHGAEGEWARMKPRSRRLKLAAAGAATSCVSSWLGSPPARPAA